MRRPRTPKNKLRRVAAFVSGLVVTSLSIPALAASDPDPKNSSMWVALGVVATLVTVGVPFAMSKSDKLTLKLATQFTLVALPLHALRYFVQVAVNYARHTKEIATSELFTYWLLPAVAEVAFIGGLFAFFAALHRKQSQ